MTQFLSFSHWTHSEMKKKGKKWEKWKLDRGRAFYTSNYFHKTKNKFPVDICTNFSGIRFFFSSGCVCVQCTYINVHCTTTFCYHPAVYSLRVRTLYLLLQCVFSSLLVRFLPAPEINLAALWSESILYKSAIDKRHGSREWQYSVEGKKGKEIKTKRFCVAHLHGINSFPFNSI